MNATKKEPIPVPPGRSYSPFQEKGIRFALGGRGTLIADEMGLGKTVEAIGVRNAMLKAHLSKPGFGGLFRTLIVAPAGLIRNWQEELEQWTYTTDLCFTALASYEIATKNHEELCQNEWHLFIFDEAHYVKHEQSQRSQAIQKIAKRAKRILALTGTPFDRPIDLWPLLQILAPEEFDSPTLTPSYVINNEWKKSHPGAGPGFWAFAKRYCDLKMVRRPIGKSGKYKSSLDFKGAINLDELQQRLRKSCMVRRLKKDVLKELPDKRRKIVLLKSDYNDNDLLPYMTYDNFEKCVDKLTTERVMLSEWSKRRHEQGLEKVGLVAEYVANALEESPKIILFAHHKDVIALLTDMLKDYNPVLVTGDTHPADRQKAVKEFQTNSSVRLFIGSIRAAGVGLTLTASSHVIFAEEAPTPQEISQAEDRAHRIGQRDMVLVEHLLFDGTLCARMCKIVLKKQEAIHAALDSRANEEPIR